jgi:hypothetical protein
MHEFSVERCLALPSTAVNEVLAMRSAVNRLVFLCILSLAFQSASFSQSANSSDDIASITRQILKLKRDLIITQNKLAASQTKDRITIYLDVGNIRFLDLQGIKIEVDGENAAQSQLSEQEINTLSRGGMKKIYSGPLTPGKHKIKALFSGKKPLTKYQPRIFNFNKRQGQETIKITFTASADMLETRMPEIIFTRQAESGK